MPLFLFLYIFGTGIEYGSVGKYSFFADCGYIKVYTSIGVVGMLCYYWGIFLLTISPLNRLINKKFKQLILVSVLAIYVMEYKEPFLSMFLYPWIIFTISILLNQQIYSQINESSNCRRLCSSRSISSDC